LQAVLTGPELLRRWKRPEAGLESRL
jgi:hypothetical protein